VILVMMGVQQVTSTRMISKRATFTIISYPRKSRPASANDELFRERHRY